MLDYPVWPKAPRNNIDQAMHAKSLEITSQELRVKDRSLLGKVNSLLHGPSLAFGQDLLTAKLLSYLSKHLHLVKLLQHRYSNSICINMSNIWRSQCEVEMCLKKQLIHSITLLQTFSYFCTNLITCSTAICTLNKLIQNYLAQKLADGKLNPILPQASHFLSVLHLRKI